MVHLSGALIVTGGYRWRIVNVVPEKWNRYRVWLVSFCNIGAVDAACPSSPGRNDDASRLRLRARQDTSSRCLCRQDHDPTHPPSCSPMCAMARRRLRSVLLKTPNCLLRIRPLGHSGGLFRLLLRISYSNSHGLDDGDRGGPLGLLRAAFLIADHGLQGQLAINARSIISSNASSSSSGCVSRYSTTLATASLPLIGGTQASVSSVTIANT